MTHNINNSYFCVKCGKSKLGSNETSCNCSKIEKSPMVGWVCPLCGSGLSPHTSRCACKDNYSRINQGIF